MVYRIFIFLFVSLFALPIKAEVMETLSKPSIRVGDEVVLTLQFSPDEISKWELPAKGFLNKRKTKISITPK